MADAIKSLVLNNVLVQENGILRNSKGRIIARLVKDIPFDSEHLIEFDEFRDLLLQAQHSVRFLHDILKVTNSEKDEVIVRRLAKNMQIALTMEHEPKCKTCKGKGTIRFFFSQDHTEDAICPECCGGSQEKYDKINERFCRR